MCNFIKPQQGFTLIEMITVIVLLGVISVGIGSFFNFAAQTFVNTSEREQLISSARFSVERLNRELRSALPNSARVFNISGAHCLEFVPIVATSTYLDLSNVNPVDEIKVIEFNKINQQSQQSYDCVSCNDNLIIYPLSNGDVYADPEQASGQLFSLLSVDKTTSGNPDIWLLKLANTVTIEQLSPTDRFYVVNQAVRYCEDNGELWRVTDYDLSEQLTTSTFPTGSTKALMAEYVVADFIVNDATLTRNSVVQVNLTFTRPSDDGESVTFNHEIHIRNTP
jgi:MSHA biogenesis protein MshO